MFYIDFSAPDGKTYRIDVSKNPVIYKCPICGETSIYKFDPTSKDCCIPCSEQRKREAKKREDELMEDRLYTQLAKLLSLEENRIVSKDEAKRLLESPNGK
ncbi:hypothetical protein SAMN02910344_01206 [Ruminobacter amylophilus]|uniref:Uncharacterized protein n=1 Tax=Ruminobacter amylophilus TaxID=867 RepID=A0A662ZIM0_9GAMM|nr:hypothetical protein [Ruminobacter amylophilus]SFP36930.1 hypothetical protein SAMN02910344_01206 [Ruminobacter amylophilus]